MPNSSKLSRAQGDSSLQHSQHLGREGRRIISLRPALVTSQDPLSTKQSTQKIWKQAGFSGRTSTNEKSLHCINIVCEPQKLCQSRVDIKDYVSRCSGSCL